MFVVLLFSMVLFSCQSNSKEVRQAAYAGQFYPANPVELQKTVENFLSNVPEKKIPGKVCCILVPHAGYVYSGQVAAYSYKVIKEVDFDTAVIIGHDAPYTGMIAFLSSADIFRTPLGDVFVDKQMVQEILKANNNIVINDSVHSREHTVEVQLPFLQVIKKEFKIVPIIFGTPTEENCKILAEAILTATGKKKVLLIASSDMSHYPEYNTAQKIDTVTLDILKKVDIRALFSYLNKQEQSGIKNLETAMCARGGVGTAILFAKQKGAIAVEILKYANSGDTPFPYGDKSRVVGYGAAVFCITSMSTAIKKEEQRMEEFAITAKNQELLLNLARKSIAESLKGKKLSYETNDPELTQPGAVFVTLTKFGQLRGCIGTIVAEEPLYKTVIKFAREAAFRDPRFSPVKEQEMKDIKIEISVLSALQKVKSADEIIPQKHGVVVKKGFRSGLFLPQVWEHFSKKEDFLDELCWQKAGLERDAWKKADTELYVFTVFAFEEH